jgi:hypothetical protein
VLIVSPPYLSLIPITNDYLLLLALLEVLKEAIDDPCLTDMVIERLTDNLRCQLRRKRTNFVTK